MVISTREFGRILRPRSALALGSEVDAWWGPFRRIPLFSDEWLKQYKLELALAKLERSLRSRHGTAQKP